MAARNTHAAIYDALRLANEPRGGVFRHVNLLVPPRHPAAQAAWIIMKPDDTPPISGSNSICVASVLLDAGIVGTGAIAMELAAPEQTGCAYAPEIALWGRF